MRFFTDRRDAGRALARALFRYVGTDAIVLALPRGGVPVADEIARILELPLDVCVVRKLGAPDRPELGIGAVAEGPSVVIDPELTAQLGVKPGEVRAILRREAAEVIRRVAQLRGGRPLPDLRGRTVILVDDGIATGGTIRAAVRAAHKRGAGTIVVAAPVAAPAAVESLERIADEVACVQQPADLMAVGAWYEDFHQLAEPEVIAILANARRRDAATRGRRAS